MHCLYDNAIVQPNVQHCPCYGTWYRRRRFILNVDTVTSVNASRKREDGCHNFLTTPCIIIKLNTRPRVVGIGLGGGKRGKGLLYKKQTNKKQTNNNNKMKIKL